MEAILPGIGSILLFAFQFSNSSLQLFQGAYGLQRLSGGMTFEEQNVVHLERLGSKADLSVLPDPNRLPGFGFKSNRRIPPASR